MDRNKEEQVMLIMAENLHDGDKQHYWRYEYRRLLNALRDCNITLEERNPRESGDN